jgi:hypothetical protein
VRVASVNHFIWVTEVAVHGRDVTGEAFRRISGGEAREISLSDAEGDTDPFTNTWGFRTELCRLYGYLPAAGASSFPDTCATRGSGSGSTSG